MNIKLVAIDLAKRSFQLCGISTTGKALFNHKVSRAQLLKRLLELSPTTVAMEACATAHYWGRKLQAMGHTVLLIPPQHVKAFRRVHKSDAHDALAIAEAAQRPDLHPVPVKSLAQQDLQLVGRARELLMTQRTEPIIVFRSCAESTLSAIGGICPLPFRTVSLIKSALTLAGAGRLARSGP